MRSVFCVFLFIFIGSLPLLSTDNFKGNAPADAYQSALTVMQYSYIIREAGDQTSLSIECWMLQDSSWINWRLPQLKGQAVLKNLIKHEQGHFNIAVIAAKELKKTVGAVDFKKPSIELPRLEKIKRSIDQKYKNLSDRYDLETFNGRNKEAQVNWNKHLNNQLKMLENENVRIYFK